MSFDDNEKKQLQEYRITPKEYHAEKETHWFSKFMDWLLPWAKQKRILGERYLESEVEVRESLAEKQRQEALKARAEAEVFKEQAISIKEEREAKRIQEIPFETITSKEKDERVFEQIERLEEIVKIWKLKHDGGPVDIEVLLGIMKTIAEKQGGDFVYKNLEDKYKEYRKSKGGKN